MKKWYGQDLSAKIPIRKGTIDCLYTNRTYKSVQKLEGSTNRLLLLKQSNHSRDSTKVEVQNHSKGTTS